MCWTPALVSLIIQLGCWKSEPKEVVTTRVIQSNILRELLADHCTITVLFMNIKEIPTATITI